LRCNPLMAGIGRFQRRGMRNIHGRNRMPHTGGADVSPNP
jgi:hypothetical protein